MKLTGRTILITGGSAGIGLAFALKFVELGNEVIVTGRRQAVLDKVKAKHPKLHAVQKRRRGSRSDRRPCGAREGGVPQARRPDEQRRHYAIQEPKSPGGRLGRANGGDERQRERRNRHDLRVHRHPHRQ